MMFFAGLAIVVGSILGGYMPHGDLGVLWQPLELLIIGGCAFGAFVISNPKNVIIGAFKGFVRSLKGPSFNKSNYIELLTLLYTVLRLVKTKGALAIESHIENPEESSLFTAFPGFAKNHHAVTFLCDYLRMMTMGTENAYQMEALMDEEIGTHHLEQEQITTALTTVGDGLPAFGIVAAVLGIIVTMGSILEPPEVLGALIGGAMVGTFLGILLAYGLVSPIANSLKACDEADGKYFLCIKAALIAHMQGHAPIISVEFSRKLLFSLERPSFVELEESVNEAPSVA
jgi:chemotaxis protein MotA